MIARQGSSYAKPWSLERDDQGLDQIGETFAAVIGNGVVSGGHVTAAGGFTVELAAGTVVHVDGVTYTTLTAMTRDLATPNATLKLWGLLTRTPANQSLRTALDAYALSLTHTVGADSTAPSADHMLLAIVTTDGTGVSDIDDDPAGKTINPFGGDHKLLVSTEDTTPAYLATKLLAGDGITLTPSGAGDETLTIEAAVTSSGGMAISSVSDSEDVALAPGEWADLTFAHTAFGAAFAPVVSSDQADVTLTVLRADDSGFTVRVARA